MESPATRAMASQKLARIRQNNERTENPQADANPCGSEPARESGGSFNNDVD
jgi:hypothetical protein